MWSLFVMEMVLNNPDKSTLQIIEKVMNITKEDPQNLANIRYSTLMMRTLVGASNGDVYKVVLDCHKEGDNTFGSSMNGLRIRNAAITTIEYMGTNAGQNSPA